MPQTYLGAEQLAERLGVHRSWVYENSALLRARRLGKGAEGNV
jgi:hypothetical protein